MIPFQKVWGTRANATHARFCKIALSAQTSYYKYSFLCVSKRKRHETEVRSVFNGCNDYTWDNEFPTVPECYNVML